MKVAIIHNQFNLSGGMESYLLTLLQGFLAAGDKVHIHTYKVDSALAGKFPCTIHKTPLFFLPRRFRKYYFISKYNRSFNRFTYDLSISLTRSSCQDVAIIGGVHPQSVKMRTKRGNPYRSFHDGLENRYEKRMFYRVPWIVAHSGSIKKEIMDHYRVDPEKIRVLYPPIDESRFATPTKEAAMQDDVAPRYGIRPEKLTLLFPSMNHDRKGLTELLEAFNGLDSTKFELLVAGKQESSIKTCEGSVRFLGYIHDMASLYRAVDYVVLPSHYEPFGLVVSEAIHCGTPVLVTRSVGAAELLSPKEGVVLDDNRPETLAGAIINLQPRAIPPGFLSRHGLKINQHIEALKELVVNRQEKYGPAR